MIVLFVLTLVWVWFIGVHKVWLIICLEFVIVVVISHRICSNILVFFRRFGCFFYAFFVSGTNLTPNKVHVGLPILLFHFKPKNFIHSIWFKCFEFNTVTFRRGDLKTVTKATPTKKIKEHVLGQKSQMQYLAVKSRDADRQMKRSL